MTKQTHKGMLLKGLPVYGHVTTALRAMGDTDLDSLDDLRALGAVEGLRLSIFRSSHRLESTRCREASR